VAHDEVYGRFLDGFSPAEAAQLQVFLQRLLANRLPSD
jgi:hypothetical protein